MSVTTTPTTVQATVPSATVVPFPMGWGGGPAPAGCCPPGNMSSLMQCWCDVQAAQAFICAMMVECINTNPAVIAAIIAAIEKSGSALPLIGVTNGTAAQPGQVGEYIQLEQTVSFPATAGFSQPVTLGVLQPGDWLCWAYVGQNVIPTGTYFALNPTPAGFSGGLAQELVGTAGEATALLAPPVEALTSVPSLINFTLTTNTAGTGPAGSAVMYFAALRVR